MRVLISGGGGLIGRPLSQALLADGHEVIVLSRQPEKVKEMPVGVKLQKWDGKSADGWGSLADGAGAIINLAGAGIADQRWSTERKQLIRQSRLDAGRAVMEAIAAATAKPGVLIQASAVGYYGTQSGDAQIAESFSPGGDFLSKVCFDWEASTAPVSKLGVRRAIIRTGVVLSNEGGAFPKQVLPFKLFAGGPVGSGKQWYPWIHIDDEVRAIQFLLQNEKATGPFNLTAPNPVTNQEFGQIVGEVLGRPSFVPAPGFAMKAVFGEMSVVLLEGQRAIPQKLLDLGFKFKFETAQAAVRALLDTSAHANGVVAPAAGAPTSPTPTAAENKDKSPAVAGKE
ncbi:TIGR01777 family oxidoreductase [Caldilinea sp.]|uniref:TIGR01777 family oxidoreductase n=1 Tax=Caldilinea sp. TaxID=2293560 RepID=UPI002B7BE3E7|nr:TIGR01777 family protein [Anaerolineales bacterium]HQY91031.1 TIGR01777 family oxidoreductase [Caldilinea sp.]